jgi:hypothetical protein
MFIVNTAFGPPCPVHVVSHSYPIETPLGESPRRDVFEAEIGSQYVQERFVLGTAKHGEEV